MSRLMRRSFVPIALALLLFMHCSVLLADAQTILLQEDFEDGRFAERGWYDNTTHGTIASGGKSGNCLQWTWTQGQTIPANGGAMRYAITPTDSLYVSIYMKFETAWEGSQKPYHPHMITIPSNLDSAYCGLSNDYLNTYIETISDVGSPYAIRPQLALQDRLRVNTTYGRPPVDISAVTETRSVNYCNGYKTGQDSGTSRDCYSSGSGWYSATHWLDTVHAIAKNQWVHVESYFKMNTISSSLANTDGIMQMWIDGTQVINKSNIIYRTNQDATKKWAQVVLSPWIGDGSPTTQTMWLDELTVGTSRSRLLPPNNFRVVQ